MYLERIYCMKHKHLTLEDRIFIESKLRDEVSKSKISLSLSKTRSTVCKEVALRRIFKSKPYQRKGYIRDCVFMEECKLKICKHKCNKYKMIPCKRRDYSPGVCNGCTNYKTCNLTHYFYDPHAAQKDYRETLSDSREGVNLTSQQAKQMGDTIKNGLDKGQSIYAIKVSHPEIEVCDKTLYSYIEDGIFRQSGITNLDLPLKVRRKNFKKRKNLYKPRADRTLLKGRTYDDYINYIEANPKAKVLQLDTVYNDVTNGPFIETFQFVDLTLFYALLQDKRNMQCMISGIEFIIQSLGRKKFRSMVDVILTDRGSEFYGLDKFEKIGIKLFYCDPMCAHQKGELENNHILLRKVLPKEKDLFELGLRSQEDLDLIVNNINSYPRKDLFNKSPIDLLMFFYDDYQSIMERLSLVSLDKDEVVLKPYLIANKYK